MPLLVHARKPDGHEPSVSAPPSDGADARALGRRRGDNWLEVDYTFARTEGRRPAGESIIFGQTRNASVGEGKSVMTVRTDYPYQTLRIVNAEKTVVMSLWIAYVPLDAEQRTNRTFGLLSVRRPSVPLALDAAWRLLVWFTERIFAQDRWIVEREQEAHDQQGEDRNNEMFPVIRELRTLLHQCGAP